jgi:uncharacterized protein YdaL
MRAPLIKVMLCLAAGLLILAPGGSAWAGEQLTSLPSGALILHDSAGGWGWLGTVHARSLANLLGHFSVPCTISPVEEYTAGQIEHYRTIFYLGVVYDNPLPAAFLQDVMRTTRTICWFRYNLWRIAWDERRYYAPAFEARFGFRFLGLGRPGYAWVSYRGHWFTKYTGDPEVGLTEVVDRGVCSVPAFAYPAEDASGDPAPYIVQGGNLWYVADFPFSYVTEEDRYVAFADALHDILGIRHLESHRALMRIEDVNPTTSPEALRAIADYLFSEGVPFLVAVVPVYEDPSGQYNSGIPMQRSLSKEPEFVEALRYMQARGGQILLHGYTHQYNSTANPYAGVTGEDFEFYRATLNENQGVVFGGPVPEDSYRWVRSRVGAAQRELHQAGLFEVGWETPHYAASAGDYRFFGLRFRFTVQRVLYFATAAPGDVAWNGLGRQDPGSPAYFSSQFFPYIIERDAYGQKILPENLGLVDLHGWNGYGKWLPVDIIRAATANLAVRDGWASSYFHPFLDIEYLRQVVQGVKALGYTYVSVSADTH